VLKHRAVVDEVKDAALKIVSRQIVTAYLDRWRQISEEANVDVGCKHRSRRTHTVSEPARYRAATRAHFETTPSGFDTRCLESSSKSACAFPRQSAAPGTGVRAALQVARATTTTIDDRRTTELRAPRCVGRRRLNRRRMIGSADRTSSVSQRPRRRSFTSSSDRPNGPTRRSRPGG
jgi:hypothetical protein